MAAAKSKKDTKAPAKKVVTKTEKKTVAVKEAESGAGSKRKRVTFDAPTDKTIVEKKKTVVVEKKNDESSDEEEVVEKVTVEEEEEELTEEQEEALRKEILGGMASSEDEDSSDDEGAAGIDGNENIVSLDGKKLEESMAETKKTFDKKSKAAKAPKVEEKGVVYLGRIPHGFYEKEMKGYFSQFGEISQLRLSRNKKTGKSKHYAFIEFESADVAQIVAETMHNYLLFGHMLQCRLIPSEKVHEKLFVGSGGVYKPAHYQLRNRQEHNKPKTPEKLEAKRQKLRETENKLRKQIKEAGIDYDFPSFS